MNGVRRATIAGLFLASVAACGGTAPSASPDQTGDAAAQASEALDCETLGYPCLLSDVPLEIRSRSVDLARQAGKIVSDGGSYKAAADWLREQSSIAEIGVADGTIRFRLDGGRPVWLLDPGEAGATASQTTASATTRSVDGTTPWWVENTIERPRLGAPMPAPSASPPVLSSVVSEGRVEKSALILAPFAWLSPEMRAAQLADILAPVRGYADRVRYLEDVTLESNDVTVGTFLGLADLSFLYLKSFGGIVCAAPDDCKSTVAVQAFRDPDRHLSDVGLESEMDIIVFPGVDWEAFGVGADFFRSHYPGGLKQAIVFFDAGGLDDRTLTRAVKGPSSEYYFWDKKHPFDTLPVVTPYVERLAQTGLAPGVVYDEMKDDLTLGEAKLIGVTPIGFGGERVREIVTLQDESGIVLEDGDGFAIDGQMSDGAPDTLHLVVGVEGITVDEASLTVVTLRVDGEDKASQVVSDGADFGDGSWGLSFDVEVPDVENGQQIALEATASLPEHGTSFHAVTVVAGIPLGTTWEGHVVRESDVFFPGVKIRMDTDIIFVRDGDAKPGARRVKYFVSAGSATWRIEGSYGGCSWDAGPFPVSLKADRPSDYLEFDLAGAAEGVITYYGEVSVVDGEMVEGTKTCGTKVETFRTRAEGVVWLAPQDEEFRLLDGQIEDIWARGSIMDSAYTWRFVRTH